MRITCPHCGRRDIGEFTYMGHADMLNRPAPDADEEAWDAYLHLRDNPAGETEDLWYHTPCGTWIAVRRNTVTHEIIATRTVKRRRA